MVPGFGEGIDKRFYGGPKVHISLSDCPFVQILFADGREFFQRILPSAVIEYHYGICFKVKRATTKVLFFNRIGAKNLNTPIPYFTLHDFEVGSKDMSRVDKMPLFPPRLTRPGLKTDVFYID